MDKYEISLWEDYSDSTSVFKERKIAVIGSDTMEAPARALEPNLVEELNGTTTFTFKMYYTYTDARTGEKYENPFGKYLINERKVKVYWKNKWYDLVIKKCQEDTSKKCVTYTCKDLFINELSKQGYSLEFDTELQNNVGTAQELATAVLDGSTWQYDAAASTPIVQKTEGPVYEVTTSTSFSATRQRQSGDASINIPINKKILVFYDTIVNAQEGTTNNVQVQFLYSANGYITDVNDMLVVNGDCYGITATCTRNGNSLRITRNSVLLFTIDLAVGVSTQYRGERLVKSQKTEYDPVLDRYVLLCKNSAGKEIYEVATTKYSNPVAVTNYLTNPTEFTTTEGWIGKVSEFGIYPKFGSTTVISTYTAKSYLKITSGDTYNTGIQSNITAFKPTDLQVKAGEVGGFQIGEKYIFRVKAKTNVSNAPGSYFGTNGSIVGNVYKYTSAYAKTGTQVFSRSSMTYTNNWMEYTLTCNVAVPASQVNQYGFFVTSNGTYWIEDIQFFKYEVGKTSYDSSATTKRIDPGEISLQSVVTPVYKYYYKDNTAKTADDLTFIYVGETEAAAYTPVYNNYEKIGTIFDKESNRFNILQSIAETFQAWVKFRIDHEANGAIKIVNGKPQKYVYFISEVGQETGISFEYGIDLKTISRVIDSDKLATKVIVKPNDNEFGPDGFCSIAQSDNNYTMENFIINLDYYTQQGLLDKTQLYKDLYTTGGIGYYYYLHSYNSEYDSNAEILRTKNLDLVRQEAQVKVYEEYLTAARQQLGVIESDMKNLAGVSQWADAQTYARAHASNEKVQALLNAHAEVQNEINKQSTQLTNAKAALTKLQSYINSLISRQATLLTNLNNKHKEFNNKYSTYLMEGTWQDDNYIDPNEYFLDGLNVAYTSSRPQLSYSINVMRLSSLSDFSSKVFNLGDICYMQDREFFGYLSDKITPYKEKILVSKISSFFDQPERDVITVQNYKTRFDDLFQRIAATTQSLQYQEGAFTRAADTINSDGTINFTALQNTFDRNQELVINSSNQDVTWDDTGITVTDKFNSGNKTKIIAGGIFVTNDGGQTWKNAVRGDGISTDLLTAGRINTSQVYIYDGTTPSFRWDSDGLTAYSYSGSTPNFGKFVRHDQYGIYGYNGSADFVPTSEQAIWNNTNSKFGLTWKGFFLRGSSGNQSLSISDDGNGISFKLSGSNSNQSLLIQADSSGIAFKMTNKIGNNSLEISTDNDIVLQTGTIKRIQIGRLTPTSSSSEYGIWVRDASGNNIFNVSSSGTNSIGGWNLTKDSFYHTSGSTTIGLYSSGKSATINGHTDTYYILAGSNFGVTLDGKVYAKAGQIGGWNITSNSLFSGTVNANGSLNTNYPYTLINSDGTLSGRTSGNKNWSIGKDGTFHFNDTTVSSSITSQIVLGPTTINNQYIYTNNISANGGSVGGCSISGGGISGGGWGLSSGGMTFGGTTVRIVDVKSISGISLRTQQSTASHNLSVSLPTAIGFALSAPEGGGSVTGSIWLTTYRSQDVSGNVKYYELTGGSYTYNSGSIMANAAMGGGSRAEISINDM